MLTVFLFSFFAADAMLCVCLMAKRVLVVCVLKFVCVCVCVAIESVAGIAADAVCVCLGSARNRVCAFGSLAIC